MDLLTGTPGTAGGFCSREGASVHRRGLPGQTGPSVQTDESGAGDLCRPTHQRVSLWTDGAYYLRLGSFVTNRGEEAPVSDIGPPWTDEWSFTGQPGGLLFQTGGLRGKTGTSVNQLGASYIRQGHVRKARCMVRYGRIRVILF